MHSHFIVLLITIAFCGYLGHANAKTLHLNATAASADCTGTTKICTFTDPKYWVENVAPVDGDNVVIEDANVKMKVDKLHLASMQITITVVNVATFIDVASNLTVDNFNSGGGLSVANSPTNLGRIGVQGDPKQPGLAYTFWGKVTLGDFTAGDMFLDNGVFYASSINVRRMFLMGLTSSLQCGSITTASFIAQNVACKSINVTGSSFNPTAYFSGPVQAESITIGGLVGSILIQSTMDVNSFKADSAFSEFSLGHEGKLTSATPIIFPPHNDGRIFKLRGIITAPYVEFSYGTWRAAGLTINGNVKFLSTNMEQNDYDVVINGNVTIDRSIVLLIINNFFNGDPTINAPIMKINGRLMQSLIYVRFRLDYFADPPKSAVKFLEYISADVNSIQVYGPGLTKFDVNSRYTAFYIAETNPPSGSSSNLSHLDTGLIVIGAVFIVIIIGLIIALIKKKPAGGYEVIQA